MPVPGGVLIRNPILIDNAPAEPETVSVSRISVGATGLQVLRDDETIDRATGLLGVVLSYPRPALAQQVDMTWDLFPDGLNAMPVTLTDPAGGVPAEARKSDPKVVWTNHLTGWKEPATYPVGVATAQVVG